MKTFYFTIEMGKIGKGIVKANNIEEAKEKIACRDWQDIYDEVGDEYGDIIEIQEV